MSESQWREELSAKVFQLQIIVAARFPTRARAMHWIEDQISQLEEERQFGGGM